MTKPHRCDVPGCHHTRRRWQRLCDRCFAALPGEIRTGIINAHQAGRKADWRRERQRAAQHLAPLLNPNPLTLGLPNRPRVSPQQAFAHQQRLLGERD